MSQATELQQQMTEAFQEMGARWQAHMLQLYETLQPLFTSLAPYLPKQKVVDRRKLSARRARRRSNRKGREKQSQLQFPKMAELLEEQG